MYEAVKNQHKHFDILYEGKPRHLDKDEKDFYFNCFLEEAHEYNDAVSFEEEYDAILDLLVFSLGAMLRHGFSPHGIREVVRANMEKVAGPLEKRGNFKLDLQKPEGWKPPNLEKFL